MIVAVCQVELHVCEAASLKEKRMVLRSLTDRLRAQGGLSVAEVAFQDTWQRAAIGIAAVGNNAKTLEAVVRRAVECIEEDGRCEILRIDREMERYFDE